MADQILAVPAIILAATYLAIDNGANGLGDVGGDNAISAAFNNFCPQKLLDVNAWLATLDDDDLFAVVAGEDISEVEAMKEGIGCVVYDPERDKVIEIPAAVHEVLNHMFDNL